MREIVLSKQYKKDYQKIKSQKRNVEELNRVIKMLMNDEPLPASKKDHKLIGNYKGVRECHISGDWLLVYSKEDGELQILNLLRINTHSELF